MKINRVLLGAALLACALQANAGVVVVGSGSKADTMSEEAVRRVFMGRLDQVGGAPAQVVYQKGGPTKSAFDKGVLQKSAADLTAYWSRLSFTGKAKAPTEVDGDAAVKAKLAANPGAIGYISDGAVDGSVKVLFKF